MQRSVHVSAPSYVAFFWFAAGALAHVNLEEAMAIHKAVIKEDWDTAFDVLHAIVEGNLSGSALSVCSSLLYVTNLSRSTI